MKERFFLRYKFTALLFSSIFILSGCSLRSAEPITRTGFYFDTIISVTVYSEADAACIDGAFALCGEYEARFSRTISTSEISRLNAAGVLKNPDASTVDILETALTYSEMTNGAFDVSVAPLSVLWNFTGTNPSVPAAADISAARSLVDYHHISVTPDAITLQSGAQIDLGGIAKGYIADQLKTYFLEHGVKNGIINLGGNTLTFGEKPDGSAYKVAIQRPFAESGNTIAFLETRDCSVVTSGCYERYFETDGTLYHHILDPATGYPVQNDLYSVTILSDSSAAGDALSTACYVLGKENAIHLLQTMDGIEAVFIDQNEQISVTDGLTYDAGTGKIGWK